MANKQTVTIILVLILLGLAINGGFLGSFVGTNPIFIQPIYNKQAEWPLPFPDSTQIYGGLFPFAKNNLPFYGFKTDKDKYSTADGTMYFQLTGPIGGDWVMSEWGYARTRGNTDASSDSTGCTPGVVMMDVGLFVNDSAMDSLRNPDNSLKAIQLPAGTFGDWGLFGNLFGREATAGIPLTEFKHGWNTIELQQDVAMYITCPFVGGSVRKVLTNVREPRKWIPIADSKINVYVDKGETTTTPQPAPIPGEPTPSQPITSPPGLLEQILAVLANILKSLGLVK